MSDPAKDQQVDWLFRTAIELHQRGQLHKARLAFERIVALDPRHGRAFHSLGFIAMQGGDHDAAIIQFARAAEFGHDTAQVQNNWGVALRALGRYAEAEPHFRKAVGLDPRFAQAWANLAEVLIAQGDAQEAQAPLRRALDLAPNMVAPRQGFIFGQNYRPDVDAAEQTRAAVAFGQLIAKGITPPASHRNDPDPDRRLNVGFVSADFHEHSVPRFLLGFLPHVDGDRLALHAYVNDRRPADEVTRKLRSLLRHWTEVQSLDDEKLARQIADDDIDILIDLSGFTDGNRLPLFPRRPAPVAATWLGYSGTTGTPGIDYVLADATVIPADEERLFSEKPWRLPDAYLCFTPATVLPDVAPLPALSSGHVTFGSFNNLNKVNDQVVALWAKLLAAVPGSRLAIKSSTARSPVVEDRLRRQFAAAGVAPERLLLLPREAGDLAHLAAYGGIDIALDPFPYNGTTTICEALIMGVPVVTRRGDRFIAHVGESILRTTGLLQLVAADRSAYVEIAKGLASDLAALANLRASLRQQFMASPMCDAPRFARNFEVALRGMWRSWCAAQGRG